MLVGNCLKCNGLLFLEDDEWRCFLCGRYYYPEPPPLPENDVLQRKTWRKYNRMEYRDESLTVHDSGVGPRPFMEVNHQAGRRIIG